MSDLVIWSRAKTLRYASGMFDELRLVFSDLEKQADNPAAVRRLARIGKGRSISAKATVENGIDDSIAIAMETRRAIDSEAGVVAKP